MKSITIGKVDGKRTAVKIDLTLLRQTRLLITADSGGGKTYLMKKIVEESFGKVPIHIIDPEGEFAPLREQLDFFLIAKGGDTPPVVDLAKAQAQKFLEIRASVICDIYELPMKERHEWVKEYLEGLIEAPKAIRHPCLVIVDEAHLFAPEQGKSVAADSMADLASRGRKRGLFVIVATQRLAKLNKDVTSEMLNRLIGPTFEDVNRERAAQVLGVIREKREEFFEQIKMLEPGHFFALGRAISKTLIRVKVGSIRTKHGDEAEKYNTTPPPPRSKIAALLKTLQELPKEEEKKAETAREFRAEIRRLREELRAVKHSSQFDKKANLPNDQKATKAAIAAAVKAREAQLRGEYTKATGFLVGCVRVMNTEGGRIAKEMNSMSEHLATDLRKLAARVDLAIGLTAKKLEIPKINAPPAVEPAKVRPVSHAATPVVEKAIVNKPLPLGNAAVISSDDEGPINRSQVKILKVLVELAEIGHTKPTKAQVAFWSGGSVTSSTFANNVSNLKVRGMIRYPGPGQISIDPAIAEKAEFRPDGLTPDDVKARSAELLSASQQKMMDAIRAQYPEELSKEDLCTAVGAASVKSSTFSNNVSESDWLDI